MVFSCEFCGISKNTFSHKTPLVAASENHIAKSKLPIFILFTLYRLTPAEIQEKTLNWI